MQKETEYTCTEHQHDNMLTSKKMMDQIRKGSYEDFCRLRKQIKHGTKCSNSNANEKGCVECYVPPTNEIENDMMWAVNEARLELRKGTLGDGIREN